MSKINKSQFFLTRITRLIKKHDCKGLTGDVIKTKIDDSKVWNVNKFPIFALKVSEFAHVKKKCLWDIRSWSLAQHFWNILRAN